jgi:hypothetical protein
VKCNNKINYQKYLLPFLEKWLAPGRNYLKTMNFDAFLVLKKPNLIGICHFGWCSNATHSGRNYFEPKKQ